MSTTSVVAPVRSLDQRMAALKRANDVRVKRARLKKDLARRRVDISAVLLDPPECVQSMKVADLLVCQPKFGPMRAGRALNQCRINASKTVAGMSARQRGELVNWLVTRG